ncbi:D-serine ammonia-lyase [Citricoccus sp. SGAir0253]|uniref:D-serine ammonia-lyase n=1 Tax=Citricoccus sp. SGAir0253 TaxID=2567881 RepID=UPI0010CCCD60|nr:D-serine ammonia-lyase [Citricoccus sp. SGAir0253]QCU76978.1 D-serine ammonia-lyase [Citricoccus sp. SGAir0253]
MDTPPNGTAAGSAPRALDDLLRDPVVARLAAGRESAWFRGTPTPAADVLGRSPQVADRVEEARARFRRFAPWFLEHFPASAPTDGILESPLLRAPALQAELDRLTGRRLPGRLWVKRDDALPVSGSIKARGGIHEVLEVAERVAAEAGVAADSPQARAVFAEHGIAVGSTGNLGLSIGIVASELGFRTTVHMSVDARAWKKDLLRSRGVEVVEHPGDFSAAVDAGRRAAEADPSVHFVDDESSLALFSGYAVAGRRLAGQLAALDVPVDAEHPLIVHLPCGVGGGPGGVAYGLKLAFGDHVHCVFAEPTAAPAMSLGVRTGLHGAISVQDIGLDGRTVADGLAVGRPSQVVGELVQDLVAGYLTVSDDRMRGLVEVVHRTQSWPVEPSATAGLPGPWTVTGAEDFRAAVGLSEAALEGANHVVWSTGGSMVPPEEMRGYLEAGRSALASLSWR